MAAYAALLSLMNNMEEILNHPRHSFSFDKKQIESLHGIVSFLVDFIEGYNSHGGVSKEAVDLESQIASAAHEAEDVIESHVVDQIHAGSTLNGETSSTFLVDLQKVIEEMDSIKKMAMKVNVQRGFRDQLPINSNPANSSRTFTTGKTTMVGFDDELIQLMDMLTGQQPNRQIIPIIGMGGIGKTTLVRNVYEHLLIVQHFDVRLWATISQQYNVREILFELSCQGKSTSGTIDELGEHLYKSLSGRRYLIVLDDMWSIEVWDKIKFFFPDNGYRSRIIVTSRQSNVANHLSSSCIAMYFLDEDKSWNLFCEKAFAQQVCPTELEEIGKKIVKKCRGLPLAIVVIAGHLGKSSKMQEYWVNIASDINSIWDSGEDNQCLNILSLSYGHLPAHLKPCFLYMGSLLEDRAIYISHLIKLWVAEGFLKPNKTRSLEVVAEDYLKDLIDRNLILVSKWSRNGNIKTCYIHDLLIELCLKVAEKEKFLCVIDTPRAIHRERRVVIHERIPEEKHHPEIFHALKSAPFVRSLICKGGQLWFDFRLLKVLCQVEGVLYDVDHVGSLEANFHQVNLRYLKCCVYRHMYVGESSLPYPSLYIPSSISLLWNLQTLIITGELVRVIAPSEIWEMPQLRHLVSHQICLPDPPPSDQQDEFVMQNLQTLSEVENFRLSKEVCKRIPNIKQLHVQYNDSERECEASSYYCPHNLGRFHKLESLRCQFSFNPGWRDFALKFTFPSSLLELSLTNCFLHWEDLTMIGSLPNLEVLKLDGKSAVGPEWNPIEGEFLRLKSLKIHTISDLIYWNADSSHFPVLENLLLGGLSELNEIPSGIGEIPTLRFIRLRYCSVSAAISAMEILVEQESLGNEGLQLEVEFWDEFELGIIGEEVQLESLTRKNLRLLVRS